MSSIRQLNTATVNPFSIEMIDEVNFFGRREELLELAISWGVYFDENSKDKSPFNQQLYEGWLSIYRDVLSRFKDNEGERFSCFLLHTNGKIQGLALGSWINLASLDFKKKKKKLPPRSYHIDELLTAPWNFLARSVSSNQSKSAILGVGTALLASIVRHGSEVLNAESITTVAGYPGSSAANFYIHRMFSGQNECGRNLRLSSENYQAFLLKYVPPSMYSHKVETQVAAVPVVNNPADLDNMGAKLPSGYIQLWSFATLNNNKNQASVRQNAVSTSYEAATLKSR